MTYSSNVLFLQFIFDRPYSRTLEAEADKVGLQFAAKVTTTGLFYYQLNRHFSFCITTRGSFELHTEVNCVVVCFPVATVYRGESQTMRLHK